MPINIAIDGPVGAGKSSISDSVAERLGILHLDTGAMYRAVGLALLRMGVDPADEAAVSSRIGEVEVYVRYEDGKQHTYLGQEDVTGLIRTAEVSAAASSSSRWPAVRRAMVAAQQRMAAETDMLIDGRDIGTVVLKDSPAKIYLTASAEERARRRYQQNLEAGDDTPYEKVLEALNARDYQDMHRAADPLRRAEDAVLVDTTNLDYEESVEAILRIVEQAYGI